KEHRLCVCADRICECGPGDKNRCARPSGLRADRKDAILQTTQIKSGLTRYKIDGGFMANVPEDLHYSKDHEWVRVDGDQAIIGITDYAQNSLGDVVYVELPKTGE